jgi:DNA repair protein RadC
MQEQQPLYVAEMVVRKYRGKAPKPVRGPEDLLALRAVEALKSEQREHFVVVMLNARHEVMRIETIAVGSLNACIVHPREVFKPAIIAGAASVVLIHNHPSGDAEPSQEDVTITRRLVQVGELVGIGVLDHVIVAKRGLTSLRSRQLMGGA